MSTVIPLQPGIFGGIIVRPDQQLDTSDPVVQMHPDAFVPLGTPQAERARIIRERVAGQLASDTLDREHRQALKRASALRAQADRLIEQAIKIERGLPDMDPDVAAKIDAEAKAEAEAQARAELETQLRGDYLNAFRSKIRAELRAELRVELMPAVREQVKRALEDKLAAMQAEAAEAEAA